MIITSTLETKKLSQDFARKIENKKKAVVIGLTGELGSGKTTFVQGLAKALGVKEKITSPTFVIFKKYKARQNRYLIHIDCYRLQKPKDLLDLGFNELLSTPNNIIAIEWAEKVKKILPKNTIWIKFEHKEKNKRKITFL